MEKQNSSNPSNNYNVPLGAGTRTTSGVTVFDSSTLNYNHPTPATPQPQPPPPPPPTYDQAVGNATPGATTTIYSTTSAWNTPHTVYNNMPTTQTTTTYAATYRASERPRNLAQPTSFVQPPVVIIQQPVLPLGPEAVFITCPACNVQKLTRIEYQPSSRTHLMAALLCLVGLWCCVCLPYCAGSCMNTHHYCGNCGKFLGTYGMAL